MRLLFVTAFFLYTGTELVHSFSSKSLVITEKLTSNHGSKVISCESDSSPAEIFWADPNGKRIDYSPTENIFSVNQENKSSLIVHNIGKDQEGRYTCHKHDKNGKQYHEYHQLQISVAGPPEFEKKNEDITVQEGSDVELLCRADGDPEPTYTWYSHLGTEIAEKEGRMYIKTEDNGLLLTITNVTLDLKGMYACHAENSHGLETKIHRLDVVEFVGVESAYVENAIALELTENSIHFFLEIANPTTDEFQIFVEYKQLFSFNNDSSKESSVTWNSGDKFEITYLVAGGKYEFRFRIGQFGRWSEEFVEVLLPATPDVIVEALGGGTFVISFYQMFGEILKGTIDKHRVTYTRLQVERGEIWVPSECSMSVEIPKCIGSKYIIPGLSDKSYYEIRVEAHTSGGYSKPYIMKIYVSY